MADQCSVCDKDLDESERWSTWIVMTSRGQKGRIDVCYECMGDDLPLNGLTDRALGLEDGERWEGPEAKR